MVPISVFKANAKTGARSSKGESKRNLTLRILGIIMYEIHMQGPCKKCFNGTVWVIITKNVHATTSNHAKNSIDLQKT